MLPADTEMSELKLETMCRMKFKNVKRRIHGALLIKRLQGSQCLSFKGFDLLEKQYRRRKNISLVSHSRLFLENL